jgi:hypothetical protein
MLPPWSAAGTGLVETYLMDPADGLPAPQDFESKDYKSRLTLDYVAPPSLGVSIGGFYGGGLYSGIGFYFSDMLGNQNLGVGVQMNGGVKDIGGEVSYINRAHRLNYGGAVAHIPYRYGGYQYTTSGLAELRRRIFIDQASLVGSYALSTTRRLEATTGVVRYGFDYELIQYGYDGSRDVQDLAAPEAISLFQAGLAYVGDYSTFAYTSPAQGGRYRFQVAPYLGTESFVNVTADYRRYFFRKPFTFAVRAYHSGNYGASEDDLFGAEYLGYSYYGTFVRGYSFNSLEANECSTSACPEAARLAGTRIALASAELRIPLLGSEAHGLVKFPYLPTELSLFADAGLAWSAESPPVLSFARNSAERTPVVSVGASTRFNLFNALVLEVFYAYPFQRPEKGAHFGSQLLPGW